MTDAIVAVGNEDAGLYKLEKLGFLPSTIAQVLHSINSIAQSSVNTMFSVQYSNNENQLHNSVSPDL